MEIFPVPFPSRSQFTGSTYISALYGMITVVLLSMNSKKSEKEEGCIDGNC